MKIIDDIFRYSEKIEKAYVTIGNFDGVHLGHKKLIREAVKAAKKNEGVSVVFTFLNHPKEVINSVDALKLINTIEEKIYLLTKLGVDYVVLQPFTKEFLSLSGEAFVKKILHEYIDSKEIFVGFNFGFGKNRAYNVDDLRIFCLKYNMRVKEIKPVTIDGKIISSTLIRNTILNGDLQKINGYLGEAYLILGEVIHGKKLGQTMGFPTANLERTEKAHLPYGIYGGLVKIEGYRKEFDAVINIGRNPTLKPGEKSIEVHLLNFQDEIYGKKIYVQFIKHIRAEVKFSNIEELKNKIGEDVLYWRQYLKNIKNGVDYGDNSQS
ncbi:MAG: bifunctional riboflavin kinase/FAD synthetase [Fusobacteriaceae bacterium]